MKINNVDAEPVSFTEIRFDIKYSYKNQLDKYTEFFFSEIPNFFEVVLDKMLDGTAFEDIEMDVDDNNKIMCWHFISPERIDFKDVEKRVEKMIELWGERNAK